MNASGNSLSTRAIETTSHVKAVLGPTNTGKTHLAVERMLSHSSGMIGLPLRLLAREIYDRVVAQRGTHAVALITGEEKITPKNAAYFVCTVEAMPMDRTVAFLAVDEIQLCADLDRGHVFTDRLLRARGREETMFLGAETIRPLIQQLLPDVEFITRPRFSDLTYVGSRKLSRLPRRSALVGFSASDVYGFAELLRRHKGGVAIVMGALSPRTRNAQVELYQNGDVDYIVATDAIGMGLNMDINHVCFSSMRKFDGHRRRDLSAAELGQIAGRAGRHMNNGSFGVLWDRFGNDGMPLELASMIEQHQFAPLTVLQWRNSFLDFSHDSALIRSLEAAPQRAGLTRAMESEDLYVLKKLVAHSDVRQRIGGPAALKLLWEVCKTPDFRKTSIDEHSRFIHQLFQYVSSDSGRIPHKWIAAQVTPYDRTEGDIDTLSSRIAHIRTWTYIANRAGWLEQGKYWQERTREIEDRLSDALHERLTQRFVDRRTSVLMRELRQKGTLMATVEKDGDVIVEGHYIGQLDGFQFQEDPAAFGEDSKTLRQAAEKVLSGEITARTQALSQAPDTDITLQIADNIAESTLCWQGHALARLAQGPDALHPKVVVTPTPLLQGDNYQAVQARLDAWMTTHIEKLLSPMLALQDAANGAKGDDGNSKISGLARGIAFQMVEKMGTVPRRLIADQFKDVDKDGRFQLKKLGVWLGATSLYVPALLKPHAAQLRLLLWAIFNEKHHLPTPPTPGLCTVKIDPRAPRVFYEVAGYRVVGQNAVRLDMLERLANAAREVSLKGPFAPSADLMSLVGCSGDDFEEIMGYLGYSLKDFTAEEAAKIDADRAAKAAPAPEAAAEVTADITADVTVEVPAEPVVEPAPEQATPEEAAEQTPAEEAGPVKLFIRTPPRRRQQHGQKHGDKQGQHKGPHKKHSGPRDNTGTSDRPADGQKPPRKSSKPRPKRAAKPEPKFDADSPFAVLQDLKRSMTQKK